MGGANSLDLRYTLGSAGYGLRWYTPAVDTEADNSILGSAADVTGVENPYFN